MPVVNGDWIETFSAAGETREVTGRQIVYSAQLTGLVGTVQAFIGGAWAQTDQLSGAVLPKVGDFPKDYRVKIVLTGTGSGTVILSPSTPLAA